MSSSSYENEPGVQQDRKGVWGNLKILTGVMQWLAAFIQLTEAEKDEAGIHIEHQGSERMSADDTETADRGH
jgi:hypothetical protein